MAQILNASSAYISAGGKLYSLVPKIYLTSQQDINQYGWDVYIEYDYQGNFTIKGYLNANGNFYTLCNVLYPQAIFQQDSRYSSFYPSFIKQPTLLNVSDQNGNDVTQSFQLYNVFRANGNIDIGVSGDYPMSAGTYYFTITGQAQLLNHLI